MPIYRLFKSEKKCKKKIRENKLHHLKRLRLLRSGVYKSIVLGLEMASESGRGTVWSKHITRVYRDHSETRY